MQMANWKCTTSCVSRGTHRICTPPLGTPRAFILAPLRLSVLSDKAVSLLQFCLFIRSPYRCNCRVWKMSSTQNQISLDHSAIQLTLLLAGGYLVVHVINRIFFPTKLLPLPPGPRALPLIGNLHQVPKTLQWLHYYHWSRDKYGPIMHMNMGGQPLILLSTTQAAHDLLSRRGAHYSDRPRLVMAGELVTKGMHMLFRPYDAQYRLHQRLEAPLLNAKAAIAYRPVQELESRQMLFDVLKCVEENPDAGVSTRHHFERASEYLQNFCYRSLTRRDNSQLI